MILYVKLRPFVKAAFKGVKPLENERFRRVPAYCEVGAVMAGGTVQMRCSCGVAWPLKLDPTDRSVYNSFDQNHYFAPGMNMARTLCLLLALAWMGVGCSHTSKPKPRPWNLS